MAPTLDQVQQIFKYLESGDGASFFDHGGRRCGLGPVEGTHPLAGHYRSKADFRAHTFARLNKILPGDAQLHVRNALVSGDWAVVELESVATAKDGMRFDNKYCWVMRFANDVIVEVRAHLDSALVQTLIDQNLA